MARKPKVEKIVENAAEISEDQAEQNKASIASKVSQMANVVDAMGQMSKEDLTQWFEKAMALIGHEADSIPDGTAERNRASVAMKGAIKEELADIFGSDELTEDFKLRAETLFEAAVSSAVTIRVEELQEQYEATINERVEELTSTLSEQIDQYITYVAEQWIEDNKVAIDSTLEKEIAESFMEGLKSLLDEHYISVPEDKIDVVEALNAKANDLEVKLNEQINVNLEMSSVFEDLAKDAIVEEVGAGLVKTQVEKLRQLAEDVDFTDEDTFRKKIDILKEKFFGTKSKSTKILTEENLEESAENTETTYVDPEVDMFVRAISRTSSK
jgi:hypothetical protein